MAYMRYKELTKSFRFYKKMDIDTLPKYVTDYTTDEKILEAYATNRDKGVFTNKKIVLFDKMGFGNGKQIYTIPYNSISTISIIYNERSAHFIIYMDSGYPLKLSFVNLKPENKSELRILYSFISTIICN